MGNICHNCIADCDAIGTREDKLNEYCVTANHAKCGFAMRPANKTTLLTLSRM